MACAVWLVDTPALSERFGYSFLSSHKKEPGMCLFLFWHQALFSFVWVWSVLVRRTCKTSLWVNVFMGWFREWKHSGSFFDWKISFLLATTPWPWWRVTVAPVQTSRRSWDRFKSALFGKFKLCFLLTLSTFCMSDVSFLFLDCGFERHV